MNNEDIQQVYSSLKQAFIPERAKGIDAVIQIDAVGGGEYFLTIRDQKLELAFGKATAARLTLRATSDDLLAIFQRKLDPTTAFFQGRLNVQGDMSLAMQLPGLFQ